MNPKDMLSKPIFVYDLETTSANVNTARIVSMSYRVLNVEKKAELILPDDFTWSENFFVNPGVPISPEATAVHGISDDDVKDQPPFNFFAYVINTILTLPDIILCGYNNRMFDDIILERELAEARHAVDLFSMPCLDLFALWRVMEPRTLTGAVKRFLGEDLEGAHEAAADTDAVQRLIPAMIHQLGMPEGDINKGLFPQQVHWLDRQGKIVRNADGEACLSFGKNAGLPIKWLERDYINWMMKQDFPADTKKLIREIYSR